MKRRERGRRRKRDKRKKESDGHGGVLVSASMSANDRPCLLAVPIGIDSSGKLIARPTEDTIKSEVREGKRRSLSCKGRALGHRDGCVQWMDERLHDLKIHRRVHVD